MVKDNKRKKDGIRTGLIGLSCNLVLCAAKFVAGVLTGSVSIMTDAINNLSDSGSSVVTVSSFMMSEKKADKEHPHGHGRFEYVASFVVGFLVLVAGFQFLVESVKKTINPNEVSFSIVAVVVLSASILTKLFMAGLYRTKSRALNSSTLKAAAADSFFDVLCTSVVLLSVIIDPFLPIQTDGYCGVLVSLFVMFGGGRIVLETSFKLMGNGGDAELFNKVYALFKDNDMILAAHDLKLHEYGSDICIGSVHAEMDKNLSLVKAHEVIDALELRAKTELKVELTIHIDPVDYTNAALNLLRKEAYMVVSHYHGASIHDAQILENEKKALLHVKLPSRYESLTSSIEGILTEQILKTFEGFEVVVTFEVLWE